LLNITHPDDHAFLKQQLIPTDLHNLFSAKTDENGEVRSRTKEEEDEIDLKLREDRRDFTIRYIFIHMTAHIRKNLGLASNLFYSLIFNIFNVNIY
jgi:hypothetical protein